MTVTLSLPTWKAIKDTIFVVVLYYSALVAPQYDWYIFGIAYFLGFLTLCRSVYRSYHFAVSAFCILWPIYIPLIFLVKFCVFWVTFANKREVSEKLSATEETETQSEKPKERKPDVKFEVTVLAINKLVGDTQRMLTVKSDEGKLSSIRTQWQIAEGIKVGDRIFGTHDHLGNNWNVEGVYPDGYKTIKPEKKAGVSDDPI